MKKIVYILIFTLLVFSCISNTSKTVAKTPVDTLQTISTNKLHSNIYIKDKSQYNQIFIDGLIDYNEPIRLEGNYIITGNDTTYFPTDLPLDKEVVFKGDTEKKDFILKISRKNLTDLTYNLIITDKNKILESKSGKVILGSEFFLAAEMDDDSQTGEGYASYQYWDKTDDCWLSIRIGYGKDDNGKQRAMLTYGCEDKSKKTLNLDECPTLRTE